MRNLFLSFLFFIFCSSAMAASVSIKAGNIIYENGGQTKQLTSTGRDRDPVLNPNGDWIYFVHSFPGNVGGEKKAERGILKEELWRVKIDGTGAKELFRQENAAVSDPDTNYEVASIDNIQFSPKGDKVYFETPEWVTSAGLHVMNADGSHHKLLGAGNNTKIVLFSDRDSEKKYNNFEGCIITMQHRYWLFGESYDWYYLFTPDFKEIGPLGDDVSYFTEMGGIKYTDCSERNLKAK